MFQILSAFFAAVIGVCVYILLCVAFRQQPSLLLIILAAGLAVLFNLL